MICNIGDLVRIQTQPTNQIINLIKSVGIVKEIDNSFILIETITEDGNCNGYGWIPDCCVVKEESQLWIDSKQIYLKAYDEKLKEILDRSSEQNTNISNLAAKYNIPIDKFLRIYKDIKDLENKF
jgi:hypothetical protein